MINDVCKCMYGYTLPLFILTSTMSVSCGVDNSLLIWYNLYTLKS